MVHKGAVERKGIPRMLRVDFAYRSSTYIDKDQYIDQYLPSMVG